MLMEFATQETIWIDAARLDGFRASLMSWPASESEAVSLVSAKCKSDVCRHQNCYANAQTIRQESPSRFVLAMLVLRLTVQAHHERRATEVCRGSSLA